MNIHKCIITKVCLFCLFLCDSLGLSGIPRQFVLDKAVSDVLVSEQLKRVLKSARFSRGLMICDDQVLSSQQRLDRFLSLKSELKTMDKNNKDYSSTLGETLCHLGWIINPIDPLNSKPWIQLMQTWILDVGLGSKTSKSVLIAGFSGPQLRLVESMLKYERQLIEQFVEKRQIQASLRETSRHTFFRGIHAYGMFLAEVNQDWDTKQKKEQIFLALWCWPPFLAGIFTWLWRTGFLTF